MTQEARNAATLRQRVDRYINSQSGERSSIKSVIDMLSIFGDVTLFGGLLRDLALFGSRRAEPGDVDLVIKLREGVQLDAAMRSMRAAHNRFGGYRFSSGKWNFDVWQLEDTWAFRRGIVTCTGIPDLLRTTFFDWDAVAYNVPERRLYIAERYFQTLAARVVDINLQDNPNPVGNALRAVRILESGRGRLSRRLAEYVVDVLSDACSTGLVPGGDRVERIGRSVSLIRAQLHQSHREAIGPTVEQLALSVAS